MERGGCVTVVYVVFRCDHVVMGHHVSIMRRWVKGGAPVVEAAREWRVHLVRRGSICQNRSRMCSLRRPSRFMEHCSMHPGRGDNWRRRATPRDHVKRPKATPRDTVKHPKRRLSHCAAVT